jgi:hypothetical protein
MSYLPCKLSLQEPRYNLRQCQVLCELALFIFLPQPIAAEFTLINQQYLDLILLSTRAL